MNDTLVRAPLGAVLAGLILVIDQCLFQESA